MKKLLVLLLGLAVLLTISAVAQDSGMGKMDKSDKAAAAPLKTLKGTIKAEGDKYSFVSDKDQKSWDIINPEAVKGHEGHHVQLKAHVYADKDQIHVMDVKMVGEGKMKDKM